MKIDNPPVEEREGEKTSWIKGIFFPNMNFLFGPRFEDESKHPFEKEDMKPIKHQYEVSNLWKQAEAIIERSNIQAKEDPTGKTKPIRDVSEVIFKMARPYLRKAIILSAGESVCYIMLTLVIKIFLPEVEHPSHNKVKHKVTLYLSVIIATVLAFLTHIFGEHSKAQVFKAKSIAS
jgi:hypothetical protein